MCKKKHCLLVNPCHRLHTVCFCNQYNQRLRVPFTGPEVKVKMFMISQSKDWKKKLDKQHCVLELLFFSYFPRTSLYLIPRDYLVTCSGNHKNILHFQRNFKDTVRDTCCPWESSNGIPHGNVLVVVGAGSGGWV